MARMGTLALHLNADARRRRLIHRGANAVDATAAVEIEHLNAEVN